MWILSHDGQKIINLDFVEGITLGEDDRYTKRYTLHFEYSKDAGEDLIQRFSSHVERDLEYEIIKNLLLKD
jgi:hypothetical protein